MRRLYPKGAVPSRKSQRGYLLAMVVVMLFLVASIAMLLNYESSIGANTTTGELESARADYVAEAAMQHALWQSANNACMGGMTIPTTALGSDSYTAAITGAAAGTAYTLAADQDAWIRSDNVTSNNGTNADQHLRFETGKVEQALTRFDLSSLPANAQINSATAWFYITPSGPGGGAHPEGPLTVHRVTADWTETGATWETMNGDFESSKLATIAAQPDAGIWVSFNLTGQVQAWANGQPNYGILMRSVAEGVHGKYSSREDGGNAPRLEVVVGSGTASPVNIQATGTLANGNTRSLTRLANPALQPSGTYTFQPDATDGIDAYIWEAQKSTNKGTDDETWVSRTSNNASLSLLKFNMGEIPARAKILSATLSLHNRSGNNSNVPVTAHRITNPWNEDFVTWNNRDSGTTWDTAGGDVDPTVIASTNVGPTRYVRYEWDITSLVQGWTDGAYENYGVALATAMASSVGERFDTSDHVDPLRRPKLTINYACECGSACMAPQGTGTIAMVVVNPTTLVPADAYKKALFESWGYTVEVIGESENQASYDAKTATSNVFFISETVNSNQVGIKLVNVALGVVSQDGSYNSDLGLAGGSSWPVSRAINVTDTSHYITAIFPAGPLDIYSGAMEQLTVSGGAAAGLQMLADTSGAGSLVVIDSGGALGGSHPGENAAGRRVMLPLGREVRVNWDYLNSNGRLILQRALQWGTGNTGPVSGYNVLLIVGNDTTLASKDVGYKALMESWGHTVAVLDDGASQTDYDTAMAAADVIYASGSALGANMLDKATNTTKGLVNEVNGKIDNFGFSSSTSATANLDTFSATHAAHYITEPFAGSAVTVFTSSQTNPIPGGTLAPDLQNVGEVSGTPSLVTLDAGATGWNGNPVPARRAHLPFASAETTDMTADGKTILQRALEWGAGADTATGPIAHWKLNDGMGLTAVDSEGDHDGTLTNGPIWVAGQLGDALDFDGVNDYVDVGTFDVSGSGLTMMGWFNAASIASSGSMLISASASSDEAQAFWQLGIKSSQVRTRIRAGGTVVNLAGGTVATAQWHLAAVTYDNETGVMKIYLDGTEVASQIHSVGGQLDTGLLQPVLIGSNFAASEFFDGVLDDVRIYDRALTATEISDLFAAGGGGGGGGAYVEKFQSWSASSDDAWQTVDLSVYGVPADAVVEVAVTNSNTGKEYWGGVRAVGSSLDRRFQLHEAEGDGVDAIVMHAQANANSQIQHYADRSDVTFTLLGYWTEATYEERFDSFKAGANASWQTHDLGGYGVGPNQVAEIAMSQTSTSVEWLVGTRKVGSSLTRRVSLHEAEAGGVDITSMQVVADSSSNIEVFAEANSVIDFHVLGYWSTPPGTYTEAGGVHGQVSALLTWEPNDLSTFGVPPNSVAQFVISNESAGADVEIGVRQVGSSLNRRLNLQEAESGGSDNYSMHVNVNASSRVEWYAQYGGGLRFFYPIGWWVVN